MRGLSATAELLVEHCKGALQVLSSGVIIEYCSGEGSTEHVKVG